MTEKYEIWSKIIFLNYLRKSPKIDYFQTNLLLCMLAFLTGRLSNWFKAPAALGAFFTDCDGHVNVEEWWVHIILLKAFVTNWDRMLRNLLRRPWRRLP